ncbi:MAG: CvpA family protein [Verrucomicrobia bacterium]|nr:MAG: CvpA family protein [Verrucomicrobiota bacterium]
MTIWLITLLLLPCIAAIGYQQGGIRAGISFFGIILGVMLATITGKIFIPLLGLFGVTTPIILWALPPVLGFLLVLTLVKVAGFMLHQKVDVHYKYKSGDLRLSLWERMNSRLGACLGLLNGVAYIVLFSMCIHDLSYWTIQLASSEGDSKSVRLINKLGRDLQSTGMARVGRAASSFSDSYYETADIAGLIFQNSLLEARLIRYPGLLSIGERAEFQTLAQDKTFAETRAKGGSLGEVLQNPSANAIFESGELIRLTLSTLKPDLKDIGHFLTNGVSQNPAYSDPILGRWRFDSSGTMLAYRRIKPNIVGGEATRIRAWMNERFAKCVVVAAPDKTLAIKNFAPGKLLPGFPSAAELKNLKGDWKADGTTSYEFVLEGGTDKRIAKFDGNRLMIQGEGAAIAFIKED